MNLRLIRQVPFRFIQPHVHVLKLILILIIHQEFPFDDIFTNNILTSQNTSLSEVYLAPALCGFHCHGFYWGNFRVLLMRYMLKWGIYKLRAQTSLVIHITCLKFLGILVFCYWPHCKKFVCHFLIFSEPRWVLVPKSVVDH